MEREDWTLITGGACLGVALGWLLCAAWLRSPLAGSAAGLALIIFLVWRHRAIVRTCTPPINGGHYGD